MRLVPSTAPKRENGANNGTKPPENGAVRGTTADFIRIRGIRGEIPLKIALCRTKRVSCNWQDLRFILISHVLSQMIVSMFFGAF